MLGMTHRDLAGLLAEGDTAFNSIKTTIHYVDKLLKTLPDYLTDVEYIEYLKSKFSTDPGKCRILALDRVRKQIRLKEQGKIQGGGRSEAEDDGFPCAEEW